MKQLLCTTALVLALGCLGDAQENRAHARREESATSPLKGTIHMTLEATEGPRDLEDMIEKSPLILQGTVTFRNWDIRLSKAFRGYAVGLRPTLQDGVWEVYFCTHRIAEFDLKKARS